MRFNKIFMFLFLGLFLTSFTSAVWYNPATWDDKNVVTKDGGWYLDHIDGVQLEYFNTEINHLDNGKAKICLLPKTDMRINNDIIVESKATIKKNNIETRQVEPSDMEVETEGGNVKKMCVDVDIVNEDSIRFGSNSALFEYTTESITAYSDTEMFNNNLVELGKLSITSDFEYKNGKPNIDVSRGQQKLTHTFYIENYDNLAITNLRTIDMNANEEVERNVNLKWLSYETLTRDTYDYYNETSVNGTIEIISYVNGTETYQNEVWNTMDTAITGENYIVGIFADVEGTLTSGDYYDIDFDYYGISVLASPIDWATITTDDLVSYYKFDETSGTTTTDAHGSNDGTITNALVGQTGKISYAYDFDGDEDYIDLNWKPDTTNDFTWSVWVYQESQSTSYVDSIVWAGGSTAGEGLNMISNGLSQGIPGCGVTTCWGMGNGGNILLVASTNTIPSNTWTHLVATFDASANTVKLYHNGVLDSTHTGLTNPTALTSNDAFIGVDARNPTTNRNYDWDGSIDELAIFDVVLDSTEIEDLYNSGNGLAYPFTPADNPPTITGFAPANATTQTTTTSFNMNATVSDDINLDSVIFNIDGTNVSTDSSGTNNTLYNYNTDLSSGNHTYKMYAVDNASQVTETEERFITIDISTPVVTAQSPADNTYSSTASNDLIAYVESEISVANVSLYIDSVLEETNTDGTNATNYTFTYVSTEGSYDWYVRSCNTMGFCANSLTRTLNVDLNNPVIDTTLNTPIIYNFGDNVSVDFTATDTFLDSCWYSYGEVSENLTETTPTLATGYLWNFSDNSSIDFLVPGATGTFLQDKILGGAYNIALKHSAQGVWTNPTTDKICNYSDFTSPTIALGTATEDKYVCFYSDDNYYLMQLKEDRQFPWTQITHNNFTCTSGAETEVNITSVAGETDITFYAEDLVGNIASDLVSFAYDSEAADIVVSAPVSPTEYLRVGDNATLNFTATDTNLDSCWYEYNGSTTPVSCTTGVLASTEFVFNGTSSIRVYANDTVGNENYTDYSWVTKVTELSQTYEATARSGDISQYEVELLIGTGYDLVGSTFRFDGLTETPNLLSFGQDKTLQVLEFVVPGYSVDTNVSFTWDLELDDSTELSLTNQSQLVTAVYLDNCSNYTYQLFNVSLFDEAEKTALVGDIEVYFELINNINYGSINSFYVDLGSVSNGQVCSSVNLTGQNVRYNAEMRYSSTGYAPELYHIQRATLVEGGLDLELFDLNSSSSTEFKLTYQDSNFIFVEGAVVQLQRKYISQDLYEVVEAPLTSNEGTAVVHVDLDSIKYRVTVVKNGVVLNTFDNIVFHCESELTGECNQKLLGEIDPQNNIDYDTDRDFTYSVSRDENDVTITYSIPSSAPSSVNLILTQSDQFGNSTVCNKTVVSSAGSIQCTFDDTIGDSYLGLMIFKDSVPIEQSTYIIPEANGVDFLGNNYILVIVIMLSLVGMAITSPEWMIVNAIMTMLIAGSLWLINGVNFVMGLGILMWLVVAAGIIIFKLAKQDDR